MIRVVGVRFKKAGKVYYFDPAEYPIAAGAKVVVETARGVEYGEVAVGPKDVTEEQVVQPLKRVVRIGSEKDAIVAADNKRKEKEAFSAAQKRIQSHELDMNLVDVEYTFDASKVIFYFTAEGRVDFRELVRDLAGVFRTRIEMRQIGVRDEAKLLGGIGPCGRILCCTSFLGDFAPVSIRMAKDQNLSLNPSKISGLCGRLMCCLRYEQDTYEAAKKDPTLSPSYVPPLLPMESVPTFDDDLEERAPRINFRSDDTAGVGARIAKAAGLMDRPQRREPEPSERHGGGERSQGAGRPQPKPVTGAGQTRTAGQRPSGQGLPRQSAEAKAQEGRPGGDRIPQPQGGSERRQQQRPPQGRPKPAAAEAQPQPGAPQGRQPQPDQAQQSPVDGAQPERSRRNRRRRRGGSNRQLGSDPQQPPT
jgi:cell fate regulator YaaT (PSP1 superfamily)